MTTDVADPGAVESAAAEVEEHLGPIDVWVNNAMTSVFADFMDISDEEFRRVTDVTYHGYVYGTRAALARMLPSDRGVTELIAEAVATFVERPRREMWLGWPAVRAETANRFGCALVASRRQG